MNVDLSATIFYLIINDLQLTQFSPNGFGRMLSNAASAISKGFETGIRIQPQKDLYFKITYNFSDARFKNHLDTLRNHQGDYETINYKNNRIPYAPSHTFNFTGTHSHTFKGKPQLSLINFIEYAGVNGIF